MLNKISLSKPVNKKAALAFIIIMLLSFNNCGKRKPPLPPVERVRQRVEISGFQRGNTVNLTWTMPPRNAAAGSILNIARADIYRLAEPLNSSLTLSEEEFASKSTLIASLPIKDTDFGLKKLSYTDTLEFAGQSVRLRYAVRFVNAEGQKAAFSNFLLVQPTAEVAGRPENLRAQILEPAIVLDWSAPFKNVDGSTPANILGYNVYRSASENETAGLLNKTPVNETNFSDRTFEFGRKYFYFVRAVSVGGGGDPVESLESNIITVEPRDIFPPKAPEAVTIAAAPNVLSIFFATNVEKDVLGYQIYRSNDPRQPLEDWVLLTQEILKTNTFQDKQIESGKKYFYFIVAKDNAGNTSPPSAIVSETAL